MNSGWVKLHRKLLDNKEVMRDDSAFKLLTCLLLIVDKSSGEWSGGRFQLARIAYMNDSKIYRALKKLEKLKICTLTSNNKYTTISICNWKEYQSKSNTMFEQPANNQRTTSEHSNKNRELRIKNNINIRPTAVDQSKPDINEMFEQWNEVVGYEIASNKQKNRYACSNLLKKHGKDKLTQLLKGVAMAQSDKYAPRISDFVSLQSKLSELLAWGKRQSSTKVKGIIKV